MAESPYWGWSILGGGGLLDSNLGGVSKTMGLDQAQAAPQTGPYPSPNAPGTNPMPTQQQPGNQPQPQPQQAATGQATATATGNSGTDPNHPPDNSGKWFWSGTAHHWVDSTGQQDATGRYLTDEEKAYYDQQNHQRATYTAIRNSYGGGGGGDNPTASGLDYDNATGQWKYYDTKTKQWLAGTSLTDIYSTIFNDKQRSEHPLSYYENLQKNQDEQFNNDRQNRYRQAQSDALSSSPTTRYTPVRF